MLLYNTVTDNDCNYSVTVACILGWWFGLSIVLNSFNEMV